MTRTEEADDKLRWLEANADTMTPAQIAAMAREIYRTAPRATRRRMTRHRKISALLRGEESDGR